MLERAYCSTNDSCQPSWMAIAALLLLFLSQESGGRRLKPRTSKWWKRYSLIPDYQTHWACFWFPFHPVFLCLCSLLWALFLCCPHCPSSERTWRAEIAPASRLLSPGGCALQPGSQPALLVGRHDLQGPSY